MRCAGPLAAQGAPTDRSRHRPQAPNAIDARDRARVPVTRQGVYDLGAPTVKSQVNQDTRRDHMANRGTRTITPSFRARTPRPDTPSAQLARISWPDTQRKLCDSSRLFRYRPPQCTLSGQIRSAAISA